MAGGTPAVSNTIALCDGMAENTPGMRYPLPSRDIICNSVEAFVEGHSLDGLVCIANCDKIVPGMLMAIMRLNIPAIFYFRRSSAPPENGYDDGKSVCRSHERRGAGRRCNHQRNAEQYLRTLPGLQLRYGYGGLHAVPLGSHGPCAHGQRHRSHVLQRPHLHGKNGPVSALWRWSGRISSPATSSRGRRSKMPCALI